MVLTPRRPNVSVYRPEDLELVIDGKAYSAASWMVMLDTKDEESAEMSD